MRAAMPFSFMSADPKKLGPALEAARLAGVDPSAIAEAEAKLREAESAISTDQAVRPAQATSDDLVLLIDMPTLESTQSTHDVLPAVSPVGTVGKAFLGVGFRDPDKARVTTLYGSSTATQLGILLGDEILSLNGTPVSDIESLRAVIASMSVGEGATVVILRDGNEYTLGPLPIGKRYE